MTRILQHIILLTIVWVVPSCTTPVTSPVVPEVSRQWPEPPAEARISYVRSFARPSDLGISKSFFQRFVEFFTGESDARLIRPMAIVEASDQTLYVADPGAKGVHRFNKQQGRYQFIQRDDDQPLISPVALAAGMHAEVYVADSALAQLFVITADKDIAIPMQLHTKISQPSGLVFAPEQQLLWIVDTSAHQLIAVDLNGNERYRIGRRGDQAGEFNYPTMICRDTAGRLYITDSLNFRVQIFDANGKFISQFGHHGNATGDMSRPKGIGVDRFGHIYVVDSLFHALQVFDSQGQFLLAIGGQGKGVGEFWLPTGLFMSTDNRMYVADSHNQRVQVFKYIGDKP